MKKLVIILVLIFASEAYGQDINISYSPKSIVGWGKMPKVSMISVGIQFNTDYWFMDYIETGFINANHHYNEFTTIDVKSNGKTIVIPVYKINDSFGLYMLPINFTLTPLFLRLGFSAGMVYFIHQIPTVKGRNLNAMIRASILVEIIRNIRIGLSYSHISNAWTGNINPGYDLPAITLRFGFQDQ